jgi:hypothetical protein
MSVTGARVGVLANNHHTNPVERGDLEGGEYLTLWWVYLVSLSLDSHKFEQVFKIGLFQLIT